MKKLFALVLVLASAAVSSAATISLVGPARGEPGSIEHFLMPSEIMVIKVVSDAPVLSMDAIVTVTGRISIAGATDIAAGISSGWDAGFCAETIVTPKTVTFAAGSFNGIGGAGKIIAEIIVHCDGYDMTPVIIGICGNNQLGGSLNIDGLTPAQFGPPLERYVIPEPVSISLLGLGGLFLARRRA